MPVASRFGLNSKNPPGAPANVTPALNISATASYIDPTVTYTVNANRPFTTVYYDLQGAQSTFYDGAVNGNISFDGNGNIVITRNAISYDVFSTRISILRNNVTPGSLVLSNNVNVSPTVNITGISNSNLSVLTFAATSNRNNAVINYRLFGATDNQFTDSTANGNITSAANGTISLEKTLSTHDNVSFVWALRSNNTTSSNLAVSTTFTSNAQVSNLELAYFNFDNRLDHRITTNRKNANLFYNFSGLSNSAFSDNLACATVTTGSIGNVIISKTLANANLAFGNTVVGITSYIPAWPTQPSNAQISAELSNNFIGVYGNVFRQTGTYTLQLSSSDGGTTFFVGNTSAVGFREVVNRTASRRYNFLADASSQNGWRSGLIAPNGNIVFLPGAGYLTAVSNTFIINYNPVSNTFVQDSPSAADFVNNGALSPHNGNIYVYNQVRSPTRHTFLEYNPTNRAQRRFTIGPADSGAVVNTLVNFAVHNPYNNVIFFGCGAGTGNVRSVVYNVSANTVANTSVNHTYNPFDAIRNREFVSGVGHPDGNIYLMPYGGNNIIRFNHTANSTTRFTFSSISNISGQRSTGIFSTVLGADRRIYGISDANALIAYNPYSNTCIRITANTPSGAGFGTELMPSGCLGPDGNVYFGPFSGEFIWVDTNPSSPTYNTAFTGNFSFANLQGSGGLVASNTTIFGIPTRNSLSNTYITAVTVSGNANVNAFYGTFLNKV